LIMLLQHLLFPFLLVTNTVQALRKSEGQKVLLSNVQTLTLRHDQKTSHRRVSAVPQVTFAPTVIMLQGLVADLLAS
ncbi:MAG: hypothetical protein Q9224_006966, partial [Gallowayella concinna]